MRQATAALTIGALRRRIALRLAQAFRGEARAAAAALDARILVAHALGIDANAVVLADERVADPAAERHADSYAERRIAGEPVGRIIGEREFWSLPLLLSPETLEPRPDTETVVSAALGWIDRDRRRDQPLAILDLGTGTGAILLALLSELPGASGIGVDLSPGAVRTAAGNAGRLGLGDRAQFVAGDWAAPLGRQFDLVVSNPPYIAAAEIAALPVEVRAHDPHLALDGGPDGLRAYREIINDLNRLIGPAGRCFIEVGAGQADAVARIGSSKGFVTAGHADLAGVCRVIELGREAG